MSNFESIHIKLQNFIKKFYINELIKGVLLFISMGLLYLIFTLLIEHFLWLKPTARTLLFWIFILIEFMLLARYILLPLVKIIGIKGRIDELEASKIIGDHFPEVSDKLLNMLQLKNTKGNSELIEASIEQKSKELQPIQFKRAIDFYKNKKYIKYALLPIIIWIMVFVTGNITIFNKSFSRVVHYKTQFEQPAPFSFKIINNSLNVIEGEPFILQVKIVGNTVPEDVKINFLNENYYLKNKGLGEFEYTFSNVKDTVSFYLEAYDVISKQYQINCIATPIITNLKMVLKYPRYTKKTNEVIQNTGNAIVPQGTMISWQVETQQTTSVHFNLENKEPENFKQDTTDYFSFSKKLYESTNYKIETSNNQLVNYESLPFEIEIISDEYPKIYVKSDIDSISSGPVQFIGQLSDDYGVQKLQLIYYNRNDKKTRNTHVINVSKSLLSDFYYVFPDSILIEKGVDYEMYFEVFDNDAIHGNKKTKSTVFRYYNKTDEELKEELLKAQKETIKSISNTLEKSKKSDFDIEKYRKSLQNKQEVDWNDAKKLKQFIQRQVRYQELFQKQTNKLQQNLNKQQKSKSLNEQKEELKKRIEETKKLAKQQKIIDELKQLSEKLNKEDLVEKLKVLTKKNKQNEKSLERILELTKRFYVEQKADQISEKLKNLAKKEEQLAKSSKEENTPLKQEKINKDFEKIKKDFKELKVQNNSLKRPMKFPDSKPATKDIQDKLNNASKELKEGKSNEAKKNQKSASKKMKKLADSVGKSIMAMQGESIDENIEDLRKIVENLLEFSFQQESLLEKFSITDNKHINYPKNIRQQHVLKEYFSHIDDSLYVLSLRLVKMGSSIQKEVSDAHYYLDESLLDFTENRFEKGISDQHFIITAANNLANSLSNLLENLMNASASLGKGKGDSKQFGLPNIIKKQGELMDQIKQGKNKGKKPTDGDEQMNSEIYQIYKQQYQLRELLKEIIKQDNSNQNYGEAVKKMEELEKELLEKGFTKELIQKMHELNYELLKLEKATLEQGEDVQRKSETNKEEYQQRVINKLKLQNQYFNYNEILNRQSLPLRTIYKKKVQEYFKTEQ